MNAATSNRGITARSVIIGLLLAAVHTCWIVYEETALGHLGVAFTSFMLVQSALAVLFVLLIVNSLLKRTVRAWMLSPAEMMVIFCAVTTSAIISGFDLLQNLFPVLLWPYYYGSPTDSYRAFLFYVPAWFVPQDPETVRLFFVGTRDFWGFFDPRVLGPWLVPMTFWGAFLLTLAFTMLCLGSILRRQWVDREKLTFPIIELPLSMVKANTVGAFIRSPLMLIGFGLSTAVLSMNYLSGLYPSVPGVQLNVNNVGRSLFVNPPFSGMNPIYTSWWPYAIGLCYLIPLDISFSCWFFYVFIRLSAAFGTAMGWREPNAGFSPAQFPFYQNLTYGAWMAMFFVVMWSARGHLRQVWRTLTGREVDPASGSEPLSYRAAATGTVVGFGLLVAATVVSGVRPHVALIFFALYFLAIVVMTRIYAQIAVPLFELAFLNTGSLMTSITGTQALSRQDAVILTHFHWFNRTYRQHPMGHELESIVFAERLGARTRPMVWVLLAAIVIGITVGMLTTLQIYYQRGAATAGVLGSQIGVGWEAWNLMSVWTSNPGPPQAVNLASIAVSAGVVFALSAARGVWFAFPLHPIGYAFACSYAMEYIWAVVLLTWLVKSLVVRYGGLTLYRRSLPLFFGLALGDAVTQFTWGIVMSALGQQGASPYLDMHW